MLNKKQIESEFVKATWQIQKEQNDTGMAEAEICAVFNHMPTAIATKRDEGFIDLVDAIMEDIYKNEILFIPSHSWLPKTPASIRGQLLIYFKEGIFWQDIETNLWQGKEKTKCYHYMKTESIKKEEIKSLKNSYERSLKEYGHGSQQAKYYQEKIESANKNLEWMLSLS